MAPKSDITSVSIDRALIDQAVKKAKADGIKGFSAVVRQLVIKYLRGEIRL